MKNLGPGFAFNAFLFCWHAILEISITLYVFYPHSCIFLRVSSHYIHSLAPVASLAFFKFIALHFDIYPHFFIINVEMRQHRVTLLLSVVLRLMATPDRHVECRGGQPNLGG